MTRWLAALTFLMIPSVSAAKLLIHTEGPRAASLRQEILDLVPEHVDLMDSEEFVRALPKHQIGRRLSRRNLERGDLYFELRTAASYVGAERLVVARTDRAGSIWLLAIESDADVAFVDREIRAAKDRTPLRKHLEPALADFWPPPPDAPNGDADVDWNALPGPDDQPPPEAEPEKEEPANLDDEPRSPTDRWLSAGLSVGLLVRSLTYENQATSNVRGHDANTLMFAGSVVAFPAGAFTAGWAANIGVFLEYRRSPQLRTRIANADTDTNTTFDAARAGLLARIDLGAIELRPYLGWAMDRVTIDVDPRDPFRDEVPAAAYQSLQAGSAAHLQLGDFELWGAVGYRFHLASGRIGEEYFPQSSSVAFEVALGGSYFLLDWLSIDTRALYAPTFYQLNAAARALYVADSAVDHLLTGLVGVSYHL